MKKRIYIAIVNVLLIIVVLNCCGTTQTTKIRTFYDLQYEPEMMKLRQAVVDGYSKKDINYPIYLLNYGTVSQYANQLDSARKGLMVAYKLNEGVGLDEFQKGVEWLKSDQKRVYKLTKRENELLHFYLALNYLKNSDPENAIIEFNKIELIDQSTNQLPLVKYYKAICYRLSEKYDDALIEYDKLLCILSEDQIPFVALELAQIKYLLNETNEAANCLARYCDYVGRRFNDEDFDGIARQKNWNNLVIQIDHQKNRTFGKSYLYLDGAYDGEIRIFDYFDVKLTNDEKLRKGAKEVGSYIARNVAQSTAENIANACIPGCGCFAGFAVERTLGSNSQDREIRGWYYAPVGFSFKVVPIPDNLAQVKIEFRNSTGYKIGHKIYNLNGEEVIKVGKYIFINPCLDDPFYIF